MRSQKKVENLVPQAGQTFGFSALADIMRDSLRTFGRCLKITRVRKKDIVNSEAPVQFAAPYRIFHCFREQ